MSELKLYSESDIGRHDNAEDCWLIIDGEVWDLTAFAPYHPGGAQCKFLQEHRDEPR